MTVILILSCGKEKGLSEESRKRIEEEISRINDNMSDMERKYDDYSKTEL